MPGTPRPAPTPRIAGQVPIPRLAPAPQARPGPLPAPRSFNGGPPTQLTLGQTRLKSPMPSISVICPTRNRAGLWRSGWLLSSLRSQTDLPDELVIAVDHPDDLTTAEILCQLHGQAAAHVVRVLDVLAPRPGANPASAIPDNCLFHAATSDIILHVDDDIQLPKDFVRSVRTLFRGLPRATIWPALSFVNDDSSPIPGLEGLDCRARITERWPRLPGGLIELPRARQLHWGAVYAARARDIRALGGHRLQTAQYHNQDTALGNRLARSGTPSYFAHTQDMTCSHLGMTWHARNRDNAKLIRESRAPAGPNIANGGTAFWTSSWFHAAYKVIAEVHY
jgi:glycosyltransferase involved in cell wall biosynthesis